MPTMPQVFRAYGTRSKEERNREADQRRGSSRERGYTSAWDKASAAFIAAHPLCSYCALNGVVEPATLTDHLYPHQGDRTLFWCSQWWVPSCKPCHDGFKQSIEHRGLAALHALADRLGKPRLQPGSSNSTSIM